MKILDLTLNNRAQYNHRKKKRKIKKRKIRRMLIEKDIW